MKISGGKGSRGQGGNWRTGKAPALPLGATSEVYIGDSALGGCPVWAGHFLPVHVWGPTGRFCFISILFYPFFFIKLIGVTSVNTVIQFSRVHYNSTSIRFCFNGRTGWVLKSGLEELADSSPVRSQGVCMCETPHPRPLPKHSSRPWFYFFASSGASPPRGVWSATRLSLDGALPLTTFFNLVSSSSQIFSIHIAGLLLLLVTFV